MERKKERKKRNGRLKKLVLPVTQNRDAAVDPAARPEIRVARLLRRKAGGEECSSLRAVCARRFARMRSASRYINRESARKFNLKLRAEATLDSIIFSIKTTI